ncbi:MAG: EthD family reductase [Janthinobacterium lividum]
MIYRSALLSKRRGMDEAAFRQHWFTVHGSLAAVLPGLYEYRQNHVIERLYEIEPFPSHSIGGISQLSFDDIAAMERMEVSPEYAECKLDIPKFQGEITITVLESHELKALTPGPSIEAERKLGAPPKKLLWVSAAKPGADEATMQQAWLKGRRPALVTQGEGVRRVVQNFVVDRAHPVQAGVPSGEIPATALTEVWFDDVAAAKAWVASDAGRAAIFGDDDLTTLGVYIIEEIRIK